MARIGRALITKSGWRACPLCGHTVEFGYSCRKCNTHAEELITRAMTPAARRLYREMQDMSADPETASYFGRLPAGVSLGGAGARA